MRSAPSASSILVKRTNLSPVAIFHGIRFSIAVMEERSTQSLGYQPAVVATDHFLSGKMDVAGAGGFKVLDEVHRYFGGF